MRPLFRDGGTARVVRGLLFLVLCILAGGGVQPATAQEAGLHDFAWLAGSWRGPGPRGATAEIELMSPEAGVLPAFFRLYGEDRLLILEAFTMVEEDDGVCLYVRHFDGNLEPMERDHALKLRLTRREGNRFVFENVYDGENPRRTILTKTEGGFTSASELARADGTTDTLEVTYHRVESDASPAPGAGNGAAPSRSTTAGASDGAAEASSPR